MTAGERDQMDETIFKLFEGGGDWLSAADVSNKIGWDHKTVVWCLTRLRRAGRLDSRIVSFPVTYRRGSGECHRVYRLPNLMPNWLMPQALRMTA